MRVRRIDGNRDWTFGHGKANYLEGKEAVMQNIVTRISSFKGDNPLYTDSHIDWFSIMANKNVRNVILANIAKIVQETIGVRRIIKLDIIELDPSARNVSLQIAVETDYGVIDETENLELKYG